MFCPFLSVLLLSILQTACSENSVYRVAPRRDLNKPLTIAPFWNRPEAKDTEYQLQQRRLQELPRQGRALLQASNTEGETDEDVQCAIPEFAINNYLDVQSRIWRITDTVLDDFDNDLQRIVDCTEEGDIILFDVTGMIQLATRVTIRWSLTFTADTERLELVDGVFPAAPSQVTMVCPHENEGIFFIKAKSIIFANLAFERCIFEGNEAPGAIIEMDKCSSQRSKDMIRFHHIAFSGNRMIDGVGLRIDAPSCAELEMIDVEFRNNMCFGTCGAVLAEKSTLQDISIEGNTFIPGEGAKPAVVYGGYGSDTVAKTVTANDNECAAFHIEEGFMTVTDSFFSRNTIGALEDENGMGGCFHLEDAGLTVEDCEFFQNSGAKGGAILGKESDIILTRCSFKNNTAVQGGVMHIEDDTSLSIDFCEFAANRAEENGGVLFASGSEVEIANSTFNDNMAERRGGCVFLERFSSFELSGTSLKRNGARDGGAVAVTDRTTGNIIDGTFIKNTADEGGGSCIVDEASLTLSTSRFTEGSAEVGGFIYSKRSTVDLDHLTFIHGTARDGGAIYAMYQSQLRVSNVTLEENRARRDGGAVYMAENCTANVTETACEANVAGRDGGFLCAEASSTLNMSQCSISNHRAVKGGGVVIGRSASNIQMYNITFRENEADAGGVALLQSGSSGVFTKCSFSRNAAETSGGTMHSEDAHLDILDSTFTSCQAQRGGFVFASNSMTHVADSDFKKGSADDGGCLYVDQAGSFTVYNVSLNECQANKNGGAIYASEGPRMLLQFCRVLTSSAGESGGAFLSHQASITIEDSTLTKSEAGQYGGGIYATQQGALDISYSTIEETSAKDGGAVAIRANVTSNVTESSFSENAATERGASWFIDASTARFHESEFTDGTAHLGGLIYLTNKSSVDIGYCEFVNGISEQGGCLSADLGTQLVMESVEMEECRATGIGGSILLRQMAKAEMTDVHIQSTGANASGGAIFCSDSELRARRCSIEDSSAGIRGGGLYAASSSIVSLKRFTVHNTFALYGGGAMLEADVTAEFESVTFTQSVAEMRGGVSYVDRSTLEIVDSHMEGSTAQEGGCVYAWQSSLNISDSILRNCTATISGGCIIAESGTALFLDNTRLAESSANNGGGIMLQNSTLDAQRLEITKSRARYDGGGIFAGNTSSVLCTACHLENNRAKGRGGAVCFDSTTSQHLALQIEKSTIQKNAADQGGGLYFSSNHRSVKCSNPETRCTIAALSETSFVDNEAFSVGGALFSNELSAIRVACSAHGTDRMSGFYTRKEWASMDSLTSNDDLCKGWKGNRAQTYGSTVASYIRTVKKTIRYEDNNRNVVVRGNTHVIRNQPSGSHLPTILLQATDELGQGPAIGASNATIDAIMTSPDDFIKGTIRVSFVSGEAVISGIAEFATPGTYEIRIAFNDEEMEAFSLQVHIRECLINEVRAEDGQSCEECSATTYNFLPDDEMGCRPCPENGKCENRVIQPQKGHWHRTPCSDHIQRCTKFKACDFAERENRLMAIGDATESCRFDDGLLAAYTEAQCRKGHTGPLCGSCEEGYGRSHASICKDCSIKFGNVMLVLLSSLILLSLCCLFVRSNVVTFSSVIRREQLPATPSVGPSTSSHLSPEEMNVAKVWSTDRGMNSKTTTSRQVSGRRRMTVNASELAKWKAAEMFKITINYLQMIALAVSVNVDWSVTLVTLYEAAGFVSGMTTETTHRSVECLASSEASVMGIVIDLVLPLIVIVLLVIFWTLAMVRYKENVIYLMRKIVLSATAVFYISYLSLTKTIISILNCIEVHDSVDFINDSTADYWAMDTSITCYKGSHIVLASALGWPLLVFFTLGFPIALAGVILYLVEDDYQKGRVYDTTGILYRSYKKRFVYWESLILLRKAILAVVVVFSYPLGPNLQSVLSVFVLGLALYSQALCRPFREEFEVLNEMEGISLLASLLTFVSSIFFQDERVSDGVQIFLTITIALCNFGLFFFFIVFFLKLGAKYLRTVLDREDVSYDSDGETYHILKVYFFDHVFGHIRGAVGRCGKRISRTLNRKSEA